MDLRKLVTLLAIAATLLASPAFAQTSGSSCANLTKNLRMGMTGADVKALQLMFNMNPATVVAASGPGSLGNESTYFGKATRAAVIRYQEIYKSEVLTPAGEDSTFNRPFPCTGRSSGLAPLTILSTKLAPRRATKAATGWLATARAAGELIETRLSIRSPGLKAQAGLA